MFMYQRLITVLFARILPKIQIVFVSYNIFQKYSTAIVLNSFYSMLTLYKDGNLFVRG